MTDNTLVDKLTEFINSLSIKPSYKDINDAIKKIYNEETKVSTKPKRPPSAYNIFFKTQSALMKESGNTMNTKERMAHIAKLWKEKQNLGINDQIKEETEEEIKEEEVKKEEEKAKTKKTKK
jgi:hypothetical protein